VLLEEPLRMKAEGSTDYRGSDLLPVVKGQTGGT